MMLDNVGHISCIILTNNFLETYKKRFKINIELGVIEMPRNVDTNRIEQGRRTSNNRKKNMFGRNKRGSGPGGDCVCPSCGTTVPHKRGTPCYTVTCPKCGVKMIRT